MTVKGFRNWIKGINKKKPESKASSSSKFDSAIPGYKNVSTYRKSTRSVKTDKRFAFKKSAEKD